MNTNLLPMPDPSSHRDLARLELFINVFVRKPGRTPRRRTTHRR